jgi:hypothetical protein
VGLQYRKAGTSEIAIEMMRNKFFGRDRRQDYKSWRYGVGMQRLD